MAQDEKELILGIDLNTDYIQVSYWHTDQTEEPQSLDAKENTALLAPEEFLRSYLDEYLPEMNPRGRYDRIRMMVTVRNLTEELNDKLIEVLVSFGPDRKDCYTQDYLSSFYYYAVNQKRELWAQDVALFAYEDPFIVGYILHIDRTKKPAVAQVEEIARQLMDEDTRAGRSDEDWAREKDRLFFELMKKVFAGRNVSVSYLIGDYFNKSWAQRSIQFLCTQRKAYQGMNLCSKGACYAALERAGRIQIRDMIFGGRDVVNRNISMEMKIRGKESLYPVVTAGVNWFEVHTTFEFIPHGESQIRLISSSADSAETTRHVMRLPGLPKRPDRATRLRMTVYFTSPACCRVEVEDLGFGGLYKSSGLTWSREIFI